MRVNAYFSKQLWVILVLKEKKTMKQLMIWASAALLISCNQEQKQQQQVPAPDVEMSPAGPVNSNATAVNTGTVSLPEAAQRFIGQHFKEASISKIEGKAAPSKDGTMYESKLSEGTEIDFDQDGNWTEISTEGTVAIPLAVLPQAIQDYLNANYNGLAVTSADKEPSGYELELANDTELYFDANGKFVRKGR